MHGNLYATPKAPVAAALEAGEDVLFDIDWQGARQLKERLGADVVLRLHPAARRQGAGAAAQGAQPGHARPSSPSGLPPPPTEIGHWLEYDYVLVNADLDESLAGLSAILAAERLKRERQTGLAAFVRAILADL